ncbi:MAG TPA: hypothetical protein VNC78_02745 [Actinomycetota bacterium]|nr:hypothetical protein [Actinomycetota bacterium]
MKRFRVFLATAILVSTMIVGSAPPASANCVDDLGGACALICEVGTGNKYTEPLFRFCYVG